MSTGKSVGLGLFTCRGVIIGDGNRIIMQPAFETGHCLEGPFANNVECMMMMMMMMMGNLYLPLLCLFLWASCWVLSVNIINLSYKFEGCLQLIDDAWLSAKNGAIIFEKNFYFPVHFIDMGQISRITFDIWDVNLKQI